MLLLLLPPPFEDGPLGPTCSESGEIGMQPLAYALVADGVRMGVLSLCVTQ